MHFFPFSSQIITYFYGQNHFNSLIKLIPEVDLISLMKLILVVESFPIMDVILPTLIPMRGVIIPIFWNQN